MDSELDRLRARIACLTHDNAELSTALEAERARPPVPRLASPLPCDHVPEVRPNGVVVPALAKAGGWVTHLVRLLVLAVVQLMALRTRVGQLESDISQRNALTSQLRSELADTRDRVQVLEADVAQARAALADAEATAQSLQWELDSANTRAAEAGQATVAAQRDREAAQKQIQQLAALRKRILELEAQLAELRDQARVAAGAERDTRLLLEASEARMKAESAEKTLMAGEVNDLKLQVASLQAKLKDRQAKVAMQL